MTSNEFPVYNFATEYPVTDPNYDVTLITQTSYLYHFLFYS